MKGLIVILVLAFSVIQTKGQTTWERSIPVKPGQKVEMDFKHPELVSVSTWEGNEIKISASVSINMGANDEAFQLKVDDGEELRINTFIEGWGNLPRNIMISYKGNEYFFNTTSMDDPQVVKFLADKGGYDFMQHGVIKKIELEIKVPKSIELEIDTKFGLVELKGLTQKIDVNSKFGGIDLSLAPGTNASMQVRTKFGDVYSNLDVKFSGDDFGEIGRWSTVVGKVNNGTNEQRLKTEFGNIYLRKM